MCAVSNVGDFYGRQWQPYIQPDQGGGAGGAVGMFQQISRQEFEALKAEVLEMKRLLIAAKEIDAKTGQPDCEMDEKLKILRAVAKAVGVSLEDVFPDLKKEAE